MSLEKKVEKHLRELEKSGTTGILGVDLWLYRFKGDVYVQCDICGRLVQAHVYDTISDKIMCLDCLIKAFENHLEFLKKLREELGVSKK